MFAVTALFYGQSSGISWGEIIQMFYRAITFIALIHTLTIDAKTHFFDRLVEGIILHSAIAGAVVPMIQFRKKKYKQISSLNITSKT